MTSRYYIYILFSLKDKKLYTGFTADLKNRLTQHTQGGVRSTKDRLPVKLIHYEYFVDKSDAKAREVFLKSGFGRNELKKCLRKTLENVNYKFV